MIDVYEVGARVRSEPAEADRPGSSFERDRVVVGHGGAALTAQWCAGLRYAERMMGGLPTRSRRDRSLPGASTLIRKEPLPRQAISAGGKDPHIQRSLTHPPCNGENCWASTPQTPERTRPLAS